MVDSGYRVGGGVGDFYVDYRAMAEAALLRPAYADVTAWYEHHGVTDLDVYVTVTNRSGRRWTDDLQPTVNVIAFERRRVLQTGRIVRAATFRQIGALNDGATGTYYISLVDVPVVAWDDIGVVALVDYRPDPSQSSFDSLQAAMAVLGPPATLTPTATRIPSPAPTSPSPPPPTATTGPSPTPGPTSTPSGTGAPGVVLKVYLPLAMLR